MSETRKLAAIFAADVVGFSKLAGADEDRTLARLRAIRSDLIDPTIAVHHGRVQRPLRLSGAAKHDPCASRQPSGIAIVERVLRPMFLRRVDKRPRRDLRNPRVRKPD